MSGIHIQVGTAGYTDPNMGYSDDESMRESFKICEKYGIKKLDTAIIYGNGTVQGKLGDLGAGEKFEIDTKWPGGFVKDAGSSSAQSMVGMAKDSLAKLKVKQVDIFYIHCFPADGTPLEDTLKGVNEAYKEGAFKRFGISNFSIEEVKKTHDICKEHGYVLPTVFQGIYSPINRKMEEEFLPTIRSLGMSFYAYSPLAGGFLTKTKQQIQEGAGRFNKDTIGGAYLYFAKPDHINILTDWEDAAKESGCSRAELAYRWVTYNSALSREHGDTILVGANGNKQLDQTLEGLKHGPLDKTAVQKIDKVWDAVKHESKLDMFH